MLARYGRSCIFIVEQITCHKLKLMGFDRTCANAIRTLTLDAVQTANSGHPGMPLGMADVAYVLYTRFLHYSPKNPKWFNRDRVIISAGHGSMLLYSVNYLTGYDMTLDDLKKFARSAVVPPDTLKIM